MIDSLQNTGAEPSSSSFLIEWVGSVVWHYSWWPFKS